MLKEYSHLVISSFTSSYIFKSGFLKIDNSQNSGLNFRKVKKNYRNASNFTIYGLKFPVSTHSFLMSDHQSDARPLST